MSDRVGINGKKKEMEKRRVLSIKEQGDL